jgi:Protein tyrosine and serine/threonine kinase
VIYNSSFVSTAQGYNRWNCLSTLDECRPWRYQRSNVYFQHYPNSLSYHGKQANILIDDEGHACLADFGLTTIIPDTIPGYSMTTMTNEGTLRWMAPELLSPEQFGLTKCILSEESDIYAFGMVVYEVNSFVQASYGMIKHRRARL